MCGMTLVTGQVLFVYHKITVNQEDIAMTCKEQILSEEYADIIIDYRLPEELIRLARGTYCFTPVDGEIGVVYLRIAELGDVTVDPFSYQSIPLCFGLTETIANENSHGEKPQAQALFPVEGFNQLALINSGILSVQEGALHLTGRGVTVAVIDTGVDYTSPVFRRSDGKTRIKAIWDQTIQDGAPPEGMLYGTEYRREEIDKALQAENPYSVVPTGDEIGHGTAVASVAAGSKLEEGTLFNSPAPDSELVVVKLRQAKEYMREYYLIPEGVPCYSESDILMALKYVMSYHRPFYCPMVICLALASNMGDHAGNSVLSGYLNKLSGKKSMGVVVAGGNEGNRAIHYSMRLPNGNGASSDRAELRVAEGDPGFILELWGETPAIFTISVRSPAGEQIEAGTFRSPRTLEYRFVYERTILTIDYILVEEGSGAQLILMRFERPSAGIWTIYVTNENANVPGTYHMWLPLGQFLREGTEFLISDPYITMTEPSYASDVISVSGYNDRDGSFLVSSGRGYSRTGAIKPDIAAPAVEVSSVRGKITGTSMAAAITAGAAAAFLQWSTVEQNDILVDNADIKSYLIRGATRNAGLIYPNREYGYGLLNLRGVFDSLIGR